MDVPDSLDKISQQYNYLRSETENWGKDAQKFIAALRFNELYRWDIHNQIVVDQEDFQQSKPFFPEDGSFLVKIQTYPHQIANPSNISLPPVYDGELWVKMKSQDAFVDQYGVKPQDETPGGCEQINQSIFNATLRSVDWLTRFRFLLTGVNLSYGEDVKPLPDRHG